jgi:LysM repeat protein
MKKITVILFIVLTLPLTAQKFSTEDYIALYKQWAIENMQIKKVPASITLAQGILESGSGNSSLATKANNHFGIKCHKGWEGGTYYMDDDAPNECFRKYASVLESYSDHADFLTGRERYSGLFKLDIADYKGWAQGLKDAGYATNPKYATLIIDLIEKYKLYEYDQQALNPVTVVKKDDKTNNNNSNNKNNTNTNNSSGGTEKNQLVFINGLKAVKIKGGQTKDELALFFELKVKQIERYNEIGAGDGLYEGEVIFLEPKRNSAEPAFNVHTVKTGETFYSIAHQYGMKMNALMKKNNMWYGSIIKPGDQLNLRKKKPLR